MIKTPVKLLAVVASSLITFSASAAEPCKSYIKLDVGYGISSEGRVLSTIYSSSSNTLTQFSDPMDRGQRGFVGAAGLGYAFDDATRAEVTFDFKPEMKSYTEFFSIKTRELGGSVKLLYDFNNNGSITPFVFAGVGASNIRPTISARDAASLTLGMIDSTGKVIADTTYPSIKMPSKTVTTYQGGFGMSFKGSDNVSIDFTYGLGGKVNHTIAQNVAVLKTNSSQPSSIIPATVEQRVAELKLKNPLDQSLTMGVKFIM